MLRSLQKVSSKTTFLQSIFAAFLVVLQPFRLSEEFDDEIIPFYLCSLMGENIFAASLTSQFFSVKIDVIPLK